MQGSKHADRKQYGTVTDLMVAHFHRHVVNPQHSPSESDLPVQSPNVRVSSEHRVFPVYVSQMGGGVLSKLEKVRPIVAVTETPLRGGKVAL